MARGIVYLSNGRLFSKVEGDGASTASAIESPFALSIRQRAFELQRRHAWKSQGRGAAFVSGAALWGADRNDPDHMRIDITGVCRGPGEGDLFYALQSPDISGVLRAREGSMELRVLHTSDFRVGAITAHPSTGRLAMTIRHRDSSTLAVMGADGSEFSEVTQGESMDESPSWVPNASARIVFQSAGVALNAQGRTVGLGPYAIQMLDLESGSMTPILEDATTDLLCPKVGFDGALYYIRRPYRLAQARFNLFRSIEGLLLFPFRLIYAFFQFFNFFSMKYTGKPLARSGPGPERSKEMPADMVLWGNLIEAQKSLLGKDDEATSLVPASWELCRQMKDNQPEVLAKGVLSFDLEEDGGIVFSNGTSISRRSPDGSISRLHRDAMIRQVIAAAYQPAAPVVGVSGLAALDAR